MEQREFDGARMLRLIPHEKDDNQKWMATALDIFPYGVMTMDLSEDSIPIVTYVNTHCAHLLDMRAEKMVGQNACDIFKIFGMTDDILPYCVGGTRTSIECESTVYGRTVWYKISFIPSLWGKRGCVAIVEDRTEKIVAESQYFQAQRLEALSQLAGGIAHDFNNLLSIIDGYARMTKKMIQDKPDPLNYIEKIMQAVQRGSALSAQLLTFGRHKVLKSKETNLSQLVHDQEGLIRPLMDSSITVSMKAEDNLYVYGDAEQLCQILLNLCINSRDAMAQGGNLIVEALADPDRPQGQGQNGFVILRVIDTGMGMDPLTKSRMFDPFFTTKGQGKGTGLGLSLVYGMVRDMGGEITVASQLGSGTSISIFLPRAEVVLEREILTQDTGNVVLKGYTAMIAEDEGDLLTLVANMLEDMGMTVLKASNGNEALLLQDDYEGDIDFLLTDVVMPEMNGVKLAELFESVRPNSRIMFMSGYPTAGQMARVRVPDGAILLPKPLNFEELNSVMARLARNENKTNAASGMTGRWRIS